MRKTENKASCEGQPPTLIWTLWYWFNRENRSRWIMMSWLNALLASVTEGGWEWGVGCGGRDGRKEWRTVSERVMQAVRDKANELDVNPGEFFQNTGCLKQPRAFINVFCSLFVDNSKVACGRRCLLSDFARPPCQTRWPVFRLQPSTTQMTFSRDKTRKPFQKGLYETKTATGSGSEFWLQLNRPARVQLVKGYYVNSSVYHTSFNFFFPLENQQPSDLVAQMVIEGKTLWVKLRATSSGCSVVFLLYHLTLST